MKPYLFFAAAFGMGIAATAMAQTTPNRSADGTPAAGNQPKAASGVGDTVSKASNSAAINNNPAVATTHASDMQPAKGANSFTQAEAKSRLERNGYSDVSSLAKDPNGVWRGKAMKDGSQDSVWLDYKGNIGTGK